ncbi:hypothetical protein EUGRSUZ_H02681 [Eucalyptus grandis]|uniref:Uncharacterized protein n=2 Tax=Eucalyptus grandis TaxID=71139 RepID=A0ACC3JTB2_EUCGR|nr:hypothetical protein EUGRSUZ_H02681 [Eucalyptus grandis]
MDVGISVLKSKSNENDKRTRHMEEHMAFGDKDIDIPIWANAIASLTNGTKRADVRYALAKRLHNMHER